MSHALIILRVPEAVGTEVDCSPHLELRFVRPHHSHISTLLLILFRCSPGVAMRSSIVSALLALEAATALQIGVSAPHASAIHDGWRRTAAR